MTTSREWDPEQAASPPLRVAEISAEAANAAAQRLWRGRESAGMTRLGFDDELVKLAVANALVSIAQSLASLAGNFEARR